MKKETIFLTIILIIALLSLFVGIQNYIKFMGSEWMCIKQECSSLMSESEWVNHFCKLDQNKDMICEFQINSENFRVPLKGLNVSQMTGCMNYTCSSEILTK